MQKYFGTDGIRGKVGEYPITPDFALRLGYAAGKVLGQLGDNIAVIIGKDTRLSGYLFEASLEAGFCYAGVDVYMAGPIPTPAIAYLTRALRLSAGVVISASHNPYTDNGIKFFSTTGTKLPDKVELQIEQELTKELIAPDILGRVKRIEDARGRYIEFCKNTFPTGMSLKGLKIVIDCAHGATYYVAPHVFRELGANCIKIGCKPDGMNINVECGSMHPEAMIAAVKEHKADFGIAFDGDGDRVLMTDGNGIVYNGDKLIYIILKSYLAEQKNVAGVVGTVMTNLSMEHALMQNNIELVRSPVGDRHVLMELEKRGWLLGGEASGHLLCLDKHSTGDGIISALQVLAGSIRLGKSLKDVVDWQDYPQAMVNVKLKHRDNWRDACDSVIKDAITDLGDDGRVVVRASGTEPVVRVMVEAKLHKTAVSWANKIAEKII